MKKELLVDPVPLNMCLRITTRSLHLSLLTKRSVFLQNTSLEQFVSFIAPYKAAFDCLYRLLLISVTRPVATRGIQGQCLLKFLLCPPNFLVPRKICFETMIKQKSCPRKDVFCPSKLQKPGYGPDCNSSRQGRNQERANRAVDTPEIFATMMTFTYFT